MTNSDVSKKNLLMDEIITNLVQQNLTNKQIRLVFGCGSSRITQVRKLMKNPELLSKQRRVPVRAVSALDLEEMKKLLATY